MLKNNNYIGNIWLVTPVRFEEYERSQIKIINKNFTSDSNTITVKNNSYLRV